MAKPRRLLCVFLSLTMLFTLIPASAKADSDTVQASGEINASAIPDKGSLTLTNDLTLKMDINRTLSHINCGKYTLTVKGDNTLSVINEGTAIEGYKIISNCNMGNDQKADSTANPSNNTSDSADSGKITLKGTKIKKLIAGKKTITVL